MKKILSDLDNKKKDKYDREIHDHLFSYEGWRKSQTIGVTISLGMEIDTYRIIEKAWEDGKKVFVPKCYPQYKTLTFYLLDNFSQLENSFYGLREPNTDISQAIDPTSIEWMIVPGLIFDRDGYRIGHGGGYYDRFLAAHSLSTISLCYSEQVVESISHDMYDIPVDMIVTPCEVIKAKILREKRNK